MANNMQDVVGLGSSCDWFSDGSRSSLDGFTRRKSVSFLDDEVRRPPGRHGAMKQSPILEASKRCGDQSEWEGAYHSDSTVFRKSHKAKLANLLKRRNSVSVSVSIDCQKDSRSVKVSPAPIQGTKSARREDAYNAGYGGGRVKEAKSPGAITVASLTEESEDDWLQYTRSRSWGKAWSKTLSPLLGFKQKHRGRKETPATIDEEFIARHRDFGNKIPFPPDPLDKRPPQHYSFLSKDYSAFSFYFSPLRGSRRRAFVDPGGGPGRISADDQSPVQNGSRHSVDGSAWGSYNSTSLSRGGVRVCV